ncbi:2-hydroxychromene-2-carboxylate isomerase [Falsiroseomonas oryziterrae]|uniref:2-hydroxychromene-2-carboxylate isomerase n=1 Tax=Falsiroseomonas oryziterrae TaxID=2911368 RepID=UPI001F3C8D07|nr:2-hydroxychromene-2-carboxylate isomerase [Roseomonas sp. NPKOSM-4]
MAAQIDYYLSLNSPWTHLGAARIEAIAREHGAVLRPYPVDLRAVIFPASGGLPLPQRSPQRQAYRMAELRRWRSFLDIPIELDPTHFPFDETLAAQCVIAVRELKSDAQAVALAHRILKALWEEERNPGHRDVLAELIAEVRLDPAWLLKEADRDEWVRQRREDSEAALARGVFGAPSYVIEDEIFWGQDRLDFVARELAGR